MLHYIKNQLAAYNWTYIYTIKFIGRTILLPFFSYIYKRQFYSHHFKIDTKQVIILQILSQWVDITTTTKSEHNKRSILVFTRNNISRYCESILWNNVLQELHLLKKNYKPHLKNSQTRKSDNLCAPPAPLLNDVYTCFIFTHRHFLEKYQIYAYKEWM